MSHLLFARYVMARRRPARRLYLAVLGSSVLWSGLVVLGIVASYLDVPELRPPEIMVRLESSLPLPPPPRPPVPATIPPPREPHRSRARPSLVQPTEAPTAAAPLEPSAPEEPTAGPAGAGPGSGDSTPCVGPCAGEVPPPPPPPPPPRTVPAFRLHRDKLSGEVPHLPDLIKAQRRGTQVLGSYKLCVDKAGLVTSVTPVGSIPGADEQVAASLWTWRFRAQPVPVCIIEAFSFVIE